MPADTIDTLRLCGIVILLAPLCGAMIAGGLGPRLLRGASHVASILGVGVAFAASVVVFLTVREGGS